MFYNDFELDDSGQTLIRYTGKGPVVVIPDGVTCIGKDAFQECRSVISITAPNG